MRQTLRTVMLPPLLALYLPFCAGAVQPTVHPSDHPAVSIWVEPEDLAERDFFFGPWGPERAPEQGAVYTLIERKHSGVNPGMTVRDPAGREWSVKQAPEEGWAEEGPVEVTLSRVLSGIGYHQPPVYFLPAFTLADDWGLHTERGGRFRLKDKRIKDAGAWAWGRNPFVGSRPYQGLLVVLLLFNSSDLKDENNTLYAVRGDEGQYWYVVRDLGSALGSTGRFAPRKNDPAAFEREPFITGVTGDGFVEFGYGGFHQELVRNRISVEDVRWASVLLSRLSDAQWHDAFRAGGYQPAVAARFVRELRRRIDQGRGLLTVNDADSEGVQ